jgi:uncharacterized protein with FMN-binding domain
MKRIVWFFMSTVTALVLLFGYHTSTSSRSSGETAVAAPLQSGTTTAKSSAGQSSVATTAPGASSPAPSSSSSPTSSTTTASSTTVTGDTAQTRWGPVQVQLTVQGGTITDVSVVQYPNGNRRDQEINANALPILVKETLSAQNANIDMVTGATVTSDGYLTSLQSALDQAGL